MVHQNMKGQDAPTLHTISYRGSGVEELEINIFLFLTLFQWPDRRLYFMRNLMIWKGISHSSCSHTCWFMFLPSVTPSVEVLLGSTQKVPNQDIRHHWSDIRAYTSLFKLTWVYQVNTPYVDILNHKQLCTIEDVEVRTERTRSKFVELMSPAS